MRITTGWTGRLIVVTQVKARNPTAGYRGRCGRDSGPWTTDMFVEAIYSELVARAGRP